MSEPALAATPSTDISVDMDSLHILPLSIIPFDTPALRRARLIKNSNLESMIELFHGEASGSGQTSPGDLRKLMGWDETQGFEDQRIIDSLALLNSYDVYCLRIDLRRLGISVNEHTELSLSDAKKQELTDKMRAFTAPLIKQIYGDSDVEFMNFDQLLRMFANPDRKAALSNLKTMADKLEIDMLAVPAFLEEYGDIFLSLAYYRHCLDELIPIVTDFIQAMDEFKQNYQMGKDKRLTSTCDLLKGRLNEVTASLTGRFENFDRHSETMWDDLSAESFKKVRTLIESHHATVGGVLCGLSLKMKLWQGSVKRGRGGPVQRAEFIMTHMRSGMDRIKEIEDSAPSITAL